MLKGITPGSKSRILKTKNAKTRLITVSLAPQFPKPQNKNKTKKTKTQNKAIPAPQFPAFSAAMSSAEGSTTFSSVFTWKKMSLWYIWCQTVIEYKEIGTSFSHWIENTPQVKKVKLTEFILSLLKWVIPEKQRGVLVWFYIGNCQMTQYFRQM